MIYLSLYLYQMFTVNATWADDTIDTIKKDSYGQNRGQMEMQKYWRWR